MTLPPPQALQSLKSNHAVSEDPVFLIASCRSCMHRANSSIGRRNVVSHRWSVAGRRALRGRGGGGSLALTRSERSHLVALAVELLHLQSHTMCSNWYRLPWVLLMICMYQLLTTSHAIFIFPTRLAVAFPLH